MHLPTPVVDLTASMRPRTFDPLSPMNRSQSVRRVPEFHIQVLSWGNAGPDSGCFIFPIPAHESARAAQNASAISEEANAFPELLTRPRTVIFVIFHRPRSVPATEEKSG